MASKPASYKTHSGPYCTCFADLECSCLGSQLADTGMGSPAGSSFLEGSRSLLSWAILVHSLFTHSLSSFCLLSFILSSGCRGL